VVQTLYRRGEMKLELKFVTVTATSINCTVLFWDVILGYVPLSRWKLLFRCQSGRSSSQFSRNVDTFQTARCHNPENCETAFVEHYQYPTYSNLIEFIPFCLNYSIWWLSSTNTLNKNSCIRLNHITVCYRCIPAENILG
jgi:hypothetical protein